MCKIEAYTYIRTFEITSNSFIACYYSGHQDSSVGTGTDYGLDAWGLIPGKENRFFFFLQRSD
jgi:hypothetical protein